MQAVFVLQVNDDDSSISEPDVCATEAIARERAGTEMEARGVRALHWIEAGDSSYVRANSPNAVFTIYRTYIRES
jgi:hypothetical protein